MIADLVQRIESLERIVALQASVIAARDAEIAGRSVVIIDLNGVIIGLNEKITKLESRLNTNSSNSSKPLQRIRRGSRSERHQVMASVVAKKVMQELRESLFPLKKSM